MKKINTTVILILLLNLPFKAFSQCCSAGAPNVGKCDIGNANSNTLNVSLLYNYSFSNKYYNRTSLLKKEYLESDFKYSSLNFSYFISNKFSVNSEIGYFFKKSQTFVQDNYTRFTDGISDLSIGFTYNTFKSDDGLFDIYQTFKYTIPIGSFDKSYDNIILPIDFQPSAGNNKYQFGIILSKKFENSNFSLVSFNNFELSKTINASNTYHKYGNLYNLSVACSYSPLELIAFLGQVRCEIKEKALQGNKSENNQFSYVNASGGVNWYIAPQINFNFKDWQAFFQFSKPIYINVNGEQLTTNYSFLINLSKSFDFNKSSEVNEEKQILSNSKLSINVSGSCEMCKDRIESIANEFKNVTKAIWNLETQILDIYYYDAKPDINQIEIALAEAGHDNNGHKAKDDVYNKLPKCCHYRQN